MHIWLTQKRYESGVASYLELLTARDALLNNVMVLTDLESRSLSLNIMLTRTLGGGYTQPNTTE